MRAFLETIVTTPSTEAKWLNTLSLLEFVGAEWAFERWTELLQQIAA